MKPLLPARQEAMAAALAEIAGAYGFSLESCAEQLELAQYGIRHGRCIDPGGWGGSCAARCARKRTKTSARPAGAPQRGHWGLRYLPRRVPLLLRGPWPAPDGSGCDPASPLLLDTLGPRDIVSDREPLHAA